MVRADLLYILLYSFITIFRCKNTIFEVPRISIQAEFTVILFVLYGGNVTSTLFLLIILFCVIGVTEICEHVISRGQIIRNLGDHLSAELKECLPIFLERLKNEITRLTAVKALTMIAG